MNLSPIGLDLWPEREQSSSDGDFGTGTAFGNATQKIISRRIRSRGGFPILRKIFSRDRSR